MKLIEEKFARERASHLAKTEEIIVNKCLKVTQ